MILICWKRPTTDLHCPAHSFVYLPVLFGFYRIIAPRHILKMNEKTYNKIGFSRRLQVVMANMLFPMTLPELAFCMLPAKFEHVEVFLHATGKWDDLTTWCKEPFFYSPQNLLQFCRCPIPVFIKAPTIKMTQRKLLVSKLESKLFRKLLAHVVWTCGCQLRYTPPLVVDPVFLNASTSSHRVTF